MISPRDVAIVVVHFGDSSVTVQALRAIRSAYPDPSFPRILVVENQPLEARLDDRSGIRRVPLHKNIGYGAGSNVGLRMALGLGAHLVLLLNNDVLLSHEALEAIRHAAARPDVGLVGVPLREPEGLVYGGGLVAWGKLQAHLARAPIPADGLHYIHGACVGITRACLLTVGMLREDFFLYWEDVEYGLRARRAGFSFAVADTAPLVHRQAHSPGGSSPEKIYYLVRNSWYVAKEFGPGPARWWAQAIRPLRRWGATVRGKRVVARALRDAARGVTGPAPADL